jgi:hypothetical protein
MVFKQLWQRLCAMRVPMYLFLPVEHIFVVQQRAFGAFDVMEHAAKGCPN